jgi:hypothetical protein
MCLVNFADHVSGTAASFGVFAIAFCLGPTTIIDSIRTSMWHSSVFGSAYALKITVQETSASPRSASAAVSCSCLEVGRPISGEWRPGTMAERSDQGCDGAGRYALFLVES